jgi:hypothetical protein
MKIAIKCFEYLTNKGNGKKCKLGPLINCRHQDCPFKMNGIKESFSQDQKIKYIYSLAARCLQWHTKRKKTDHYYQQIEPQIEVICTKIKCQKEKILLKK